jgi:hypothetical protein
MCGAARRQAMSRSKGLPARTRRLRCRIQASTSASRDAAKDVVAVPGEVGIARSHRTGWQQQRFRQRRSAERRLRARVTPQPWVSSSVPTSRTAMPARQPFRGRYESGLPDRPVTAVAVSKLRARTVCHESCEYPSCPAGSSGRPRYSSRTSRRKRRATASFGLCAYLSNSSML